MIEKNTPQVLKKLGLSFTTLINQTMEMISDPATLGIYVYLSSKPDGWVIREQELMKRFNKGRDYIRARISELKHIGLMESISTRNEKGQIIGWTTILHNHITENPSYGHQITENPAAGNPTHVVDPTHINKRDLEIKEKDINTCASLSESTIVDLFFFDWFWNIYPSKKAKKKCLEIWKRKKLESIGTEIIAKLQKQIVSDAQWKSGYIPNPSTYLSQERWEDEITTARSTQHVKLTKSPYETKPEFKIDKYQQYNQDGIIYREIVSGVNSGSNTLPQGLIDLKNSLGMK